MRWSEAIQGLVRLGVSASLVTLVVAAHAAPLDAPGILTERAERGDARAQFELGSHYLLDQAGVPDYRSAAIWYTQAAASGIASAQFNLGLFHQQGHGVAVDREAALRWYAMAAEQGHLGAQHNLGVLYADGEDGSADPATARFWFGQAAQGGFPEAQYNFGVMLLTGSGGAKDSALARSWLRKAADQGVVEARALLTDMGAEDPQAPAAVDAAARSAVPDTVTAPPTSANGSDFGVHRAQLIALFSEEDALAYWRDLRQSQPELLRDLEPVVEPLQSRASSVVLYRLQVRGFENRRSARAFCARIRELDAQSDCFVVEGRA